MNAIERAYREGFGDGRIIGEESLISEEWTESEAKQDAERYDDLIAILRNIHDNVKGSWWLTQKQATHKLKMVEVMIAAVIKPSEK